MSTLLLGLALTVAAPGAKDPPKNDPSGLVGEWALESGFSGGMAEDHPPGVTWRFTADGKSVITVPDGRAGGGGTYTTDRKKDPPQVDINDGTKGNGLRGIYKVEGDTLTLCIVRERAGDRPTRFESPAGAKAELLVLKRVKKKE
jgi:uncharacterized protein (TIGR03067 family)